MHAAKSNFSKLVKRAAAGEQVLIANRGKPTAMLSRIPSCHNEVPGIFSGERFRWLMISTLKRYVWRLTPRRTSIQSF